MAAKILEAGKNPGLGVKSLHEQGITGKGVNAAIMDTVIFQDHPEYAGKIVGYYDTGAKNTKNGAVHGRP